MHFNSWLILLAIVALIVGYFIVKSIKHGGLKGAMFDARIASTLGQVGASGLKYARISLRVHMLKAESPEKVIGLEVVAKTFGSYEMMPIKLSALEAKRLATLLLQSTAAAERDPG